jgi:ankyrin repeat protein
VYNKHNELAALLASKGADVNAKEPNGWAPLMFAAMHGNTECIKILLEAGADVNTTTNDGETPLQRAEKIQESGLKDMSETIQILKDAGAK